jgi:hypothetical protein
MSAVLYDLAQMRATLARARSGAAAARSCAYSAAAGGRPSSRREMGW